MVGARQAVKLGMADRIATIEEVIADLLGNPLSSGNARAIQPNDLSPAADDSSDSAAAEKEREAQALRDYVRQYK